MKIQENSIITTSDITIDLLKKHNKKIILQVLINKDNIKNAE